MTQNLIFGAFIPQGWKMELNAIDSPAAKWDKSIEIAQLAEELGYDSVWVYDHFHNVPKPAHETVFECWTTMAAISQRTSRVRLGQMVSCNSYRSPAVVAKITSTLDVISGGRLDFGIGAGWYEHEYKGYGFDFAAPKDRIGMLSESVQIIRSMWTEPDTSFVGKHYRMDGAQCYPKPLQHPYPPIWIGGGGEQLTLRVVAKYADYSNFSGTLEFWKAKSEILAQHCKAVGRDYATIGRTVAGDCLIRETEAEIQAVGSKSLLGEPLEKWRANHFVGTVEQVTERMQSFIDAGCVGFVPWMADYPETTTLRLLAERVIPALRAR
jgi:F420-dependent oxidoreductase-like protein